MVTASGSSAASVAPDQRSPTGVRAASKRWHRVYRTSLPGRPMAWAACRTADTGTPPAGPLAAGADPEDPFVDTLPDLVRVTGVQAEPRGTQRSGGFRHPGGNQGLFFGEVEATSTTCRSTWCSSPSIEVVYSRQKCSTGANKPSPECARISTRPWPSSKEPRPCSPARAVPTEGGALPPARLPQRCLIQSVAARLRRHDHQPSPGWQVLVTVTLRQLTRRPASGHSPGIHRQPETTRLARSSCPTQRTGLAP